MRIAIKIKIVAIMLVCLLFGYSESCAIEEKSLQKTVFDYFTLDQSRIIIPVHHGTTLDHDYFAANQNPDIKQLLDLVEKFHLNNELFVNLSSGKYSYALNDIKYTLERFPNHPKGLQLMGSIAKLTDSPSLAIAYYERALRLFPQYALTHAQYGAYLVDIGRFAMGISKLQKSIEIDPKLTLAYAWLAKAYSETGKLELAHQAGARARDLGYQGKLPNEIQGKKAN